MNTKTIKFDLNKYKLYEKIKAKQGDTKSRFLLFQLLDGSIPFNLTNRSVRAYMVKPDGKEIFNDLIINNYSLGYCTLELTNQVLAVSGTVKIELMVTEEDKKLTSSVFELEVVKSINSEKSIVSTNEFTALLNGLASLSEYDNYKNSVKSMEINKADKAKVEEKFGEVYEQLEHKANKEDVDEISNNKADKTALENTNSNLATQANRIDNLIIHSGEGTDKDAEVIDGRTGIDGTTFSLIGDNIRTTSNNIYSFINNVFNFKNDYITNLLNKDNMTNGKMINGNGEEDTHNGCSFTNDYLYLTAGESIILNFATYITIAKYNESKTFVGTEIVNNENLPYKFTADVNCYLRFNVYNEFKNTAMVVKGNVLPSKYITYGEKIPYPSELTFNDFQKVYNVINENFITNLINKANMTDGKIIDANGGETDYGTGHYTNDYLLLRKNESIIINFSTYLTIPLYNLNKVFKTNIVVTDEELPFVYTATEDCYVRFNVYEKDKNNAMVIKGENLPSTYIPYGKYVLKNTGNNSRFNNVLTGNYLFTGDSIAYGAGATEAGGYAKIIAKYNKDMSHKNIAVSGAILCRRVEGDSGSTVLEQIENEIALNNIYNHVVLEGAINDIWNLDKYPLGTYDRYNKNSELDETTICGAFESIIRKSKNAWNDAIIYYIIPHLMSAELATPIFDTLIEICKKYGVILIDLRYLSGEDVSIEYVKKTYTLTDGVGDGVHNNDLGYEKFYVKPIIDELAKHQ